MTNTTFDLYTNAIRVMCGTCKIRAVKKGDVSKRDVLRYALARAVSANFNNCIRAGFTSENAYNHAVRFASDEISDSDICEIMQIAALSLFESLSLDIDESESIKIAHRAANRYLDNLRESRRAVMTENDLFALFAANARKIARAAAVNNDVKALFDRLQLTEIQVEICDLLASGKSRRETAKVLNVQHNTVNYHVQRIQKMLIAMPEIQKYLID